MRLPALRTTAILEPHALSVATHLAVSELLVEGQSRNTLASYRSALRYWAGWFELRYGRPIQLPVPIPAVLQFIVDHAERTNAAGLTIELPPPLDVLLVKAGIKSREGALSLSTIVHRVAVLSKAHQLRNLANPCRDVRVRELMAMTRRAHVKRGVRAHKKDALTDESLQRVLATCDSSLQGKRDRALVLFSWGSGGRRRSEVASAEMVFLTSTGDGEYVYELAHSKTNQAGIDRDDNYKPVPGEAAHALTEWLEAAGITSGRIFRRLYRGGGIGAELSPDAIAAIIRKRCALAGLEGDYSAHSLRSGFVTSALAQATPLSEVMALTGHRDPKTVLGYARTFQPKRLEIARNLLARARLDTEKGPPIA